MQLMQKLFANAALPTDFYRMRERAADAWWQAEMAFIADRAHYAAWFGPLDNDEAGVGMPTLQS
jgi:hypothetical protein